ncbi:MAG TPA: outer membrane beta-barrel protein [Flavisolibacter sp.]|nr:outer membrane beta-barrel protein [Flavisolibacter sp.]
MLRNFFAITIAMSALYTTKAQDSTRTPSLSITGSADVYYKYDFGQTKSNNLTSFTNSHNRFELGMASIKLDYTSNQVELVADLGVGKRAQEFSYNDAGALAAVKQLYISYAPGDWLKFTAGSWATHVGYELVDAYANRNYSMSYMFSYGPFFHTGIKTEIGYQNSTLMLGIVNPTDYKYLPDAVGNKKFFIAQYSFSSSDAFKFYLNYLSGENIDTSKIRQVDLTLTSQVSKKFSMGYNGTINTIKNYLGDKTFDVNKSWWGSALYLNYDPSSQFGLTLREEFFSDGDGLKITGLDGSGQILSTTLSANLKVDNLIFIPEIRVDKSNKAIFLTKDGSASSSATNFLLAAVYKF